MARAVLEIAADTSGIEAAFGRLRTEAQRLEQQMRAVFAGVAQQGTRAYRDSARTQAAEARRGAQASEREAQRAVLAFVRGEEQKRRAARMTVANQERAERQATELAAQEARKRGLTAEQEARVRTTALQRFTREFEREERRQTQIAQQQNRIRERDGRTVAFGIRRGLNVGGDAAMNVARQAHSQIQDARRQRAESEHTLNAAFYQAGIDRPEAAQMQSALRTALASGPLRGLSMEDVAQGIMGAQTQFSVLTGANAGERSANFQRQLQLAAFARNTFQDPAEVMRVAGMLGQQGIRGNDQMAVLHSLTGMAQAGSIELSTLTSTAMGPLMQNIARVTNSQQTAAQRAAAVRGAVSQTMAVGEISAAAGLTPRDSLNALAKMRTSIENPMMAERLSARLTAAGRGDLAQQLITRDASGRAQLATRDPVQFMSQLVSGMGGDANAVTNLLSAGGRNAAMVLDSPQRRLITGMASQTQGGGTIASRVAEMQAQGARFGEADVERGRVIAEGEQRAGLQSAEETRLNALTDNTSEVVKLSNRFADFVARNPITSSVLQTGGGLLSGLLGGAFINRAGRALAGNSVAARLVQAVSGTSGAAAVEGAGATAAGIGATGLALGTAGVAAMGLQAREAVTGQRVGGGTATTAERAQAAMALLSPGSAIGRTIGMAIIDAFRANPITATVSPTDAQHAATQAAPAAGRR